MAAASEAAWFNLARNLAAPNGRLARLAADGGAIGTVIKLAADRLRELKARSLRVNEVEAAAHRMRDIRNYALHPARDDAELHAWLTEAGATVLTVASRTYFVKLADLMREYGGSKEELGSKVRACAADVD